MEIATGQADLTGDEDYDNALAAEHLAILQRTIPHPIAVNSERTRVMTTTTPSQDAMVDTGEPQPPAIAYLARITAALESWLPSVTSPSHRQPGSGAAVLPGLSGEDGAAIKSLKTDMTEIKTQLAQIKELLTAKRGEVVKEAYTVDEVSEKTKFKPFTIRQACNKGRINGAYKGRDHAWRIPHASLLDLLTNGLPPE